MAKYLLRKLCLDESLNLTHVYQWNLPNPKLDITRLIGHPPKNAKAVIKCGARREKGEKKKAKE
jgi:hypothetical protein